VTATQEQTPNGVDGLAPVVASAGPGARLRAAREAAGLSLDQVAQQLKLAPRQVKALEDESFGELPGRTFSRGFVRNYARLLHLDAADLLAHLPDVAQAPALESPTLHSTGTMIAELPSAGAPKAGLGRWLIPLILIGCIVAAAAYEWYRGGLSNGAEPARSVSDATDRRAPAAAASSVALPNPLASVTQTAAPQAAAPAESTPPQAAVSLTATPAASMRDSSSASASKSTSAATAAPGDSTLLLTYQGPSWTEIRDRSGQLVLSRLVAPGSVEPVKGTPPFDIILGNAHVVTLVYRGKSVDLSPHIRQNVARLTLQ
jgi:cytoskeleton protein RodZ